MIAAASPFPDPTGLIEVNINRILPRSLICIAASLPALGLSQSVSAEPNIAMDSAVFVERTQPGNLRSLEPVSQLIRGDKVVTIVSWHNFGGDGGFTITNPLPRSIAFQKSARQDEEISVDGGQTWGRLGKMRAGSHIATPEDVTHVRWRISEARAANGQGHIVYSGIVR